jgi:hypothetical protein
MFALVVEGVDETTESQSICLSKSILRVSHQINFTLSNQSALASLIKARSGSWHHEFLSGKQQLGILFCETSQQIGSRPRL